jgi:hypothetical protein
MYLRHYSSREYADGRAREQFVGPGEKWVFRTEPPTLCGCGASSLTIASTSEPANDSKASIAPCSETSRRTAARTLSGKRTRLLMRSGLIAGITPTSIRKRSPQLTLDSAFSVPDGWSPAENDVHADGFDPAKDTAQPMRHYMKRDLPAVLDADFVAVLPGWERSQGAQLEVHVARTCGIPVLDAATLEPAAAQGAMCSMGGYCDQAPPCSSPEKCAKRVASEREASGKPYHIYEHLKYTDAIVDAPRQLLAYAETPGRTMQGARKHLEQCGIEYRHCWPDWAYESGHLTKGGLAELVHRMMEAERYVAR